MTVRVNRYICSILTLVLCGFSNEDQLERVEAIPEDSELGKLQYYEHG